jgi:glycogen(starch) synthase
MIDGELSTMKIKKIVVTGDPSFMYRHQDFWQAMSPYVEHLETIASSETLLIKTKALSSKLNYAISHKTLQPISFYKSSQAFVLKSQQIEHKIRKLKYTPDLVFHLYGMYSPLYHKFDIPYAIYLDYTMILGERNWTHWAPFPNYKERNDWVDLERRNYERAHHLFSMSEQVKSSLVEDYGIAPEKISVVGVSGNYKEPYDGPKSFGSKQILFNGSEFARKGGDLVLEAFRKVRKIIPNAQLVIIGKDLKIEEEGVNNIGSISSRSEMFNLFLNTDIVVAPARCDPFPLFVIEAMNYGIPSIVSANDGMPEIVDHEVTGIVINQYKSDILAAQIIRLLSDTSLLESMSKKARDKVKIRFNWQCVAQKIFQALSN